MNFDIHYILGRNDVVEVSARSQFHFVCFLQLTLRSRDQYALRVQQMWRNISKSTSPVRPFLLERAQLRQDSADISYVVYNGVDALLILFANQTYDVLIRPGAASSRYPHPQIGRAHV